jgi:hypothetical protein
MLFYLLWLMPALLDIRLWGLDETELGIWAGLVAALGLMLAGRLGTGHDPVEHMRARLWPTLDRYQVLAPGEPIPTRRAAS